MIRKSLILLSLCFYFPLLANDISEVIKSQTSIKEIYQSKLECEKALTTDNFQKCWLVIFRSNKLVEGVEVFLEGGMPNHQHGLPTSPRLVWDKDLKAYLVQGLKFSMPGQWVLSFKVNAKDDNLKDQITMMLEVD